MEKLSRTACRAGRRHERGTISDMRCQVSSAKVSKTDAGVRAPIAGVTTMTTNDASAVRDFDFLVGEWRVEHRRLKERLAGSTQWIAFSGTSKAQPVMDGAANGRPFSACAWILCRA